MNNTDELLKCLREYQPRKELNIEKIINNHIDLTEDFLFENIKTYKDVCHYLNEPLEILPYLQIKQIEKLFNGNWYKDHSNNQENWYPYFVYDKVSGCLVFNGSLCNYAGFAGQVAFYKSEVISNFIGKTFVNIYNKL